MQEKEWLRARKKLLEQVRSQVRLLAGPLTRDLRSYLKDYKSEFKKTWQVSNRGDFERELKEASIVLGGDFHAFSQSQRLHLRILRECHRPLVLGFECIESKHQKWVDQYLRAEITDEEFLKKVQWDRHWGFPWENYRPLFEWAKKNQVPVFGINRYEVDRTHQSLERRDLHAAAKIKEIRKKFPDHLCYVLFGDLHLAKPHLPQALQDVFEVDQRPLILFQNAEELYFRLARQGLESEVEWLSRSKRHFCHISSPPWVKWQSYLMFLEHNFDHGLLEVEDDEEEDSDEELDLTDQLSGLVQFLSRDLKLKISVDELAVYSPGQLSIESILQKELPASQKRMAHKLVQEDRSFYIPEVGLLYLSRLSINHAAALAGRYIHAQLHQSKRLFWDQPEDFVRCIWQEAVAFFFSKLINHRRKSENLRSLKARMAVVDLKDLAQDALKMALDQRMLEVIYVHTGRIRSLRVKSKKDWVYLEAARITGEMMGEKLYEAFRVRRFSRDQLIKWLKVDPDSDEFDKMYLSLVKRLESVKLNHLEEESEVSSW